MTYLLWAGAVGLLGFVATFLVDGATRPGYSVRRHPVSALALGPRGHVQTLSFVVCGLATALGGVGLAAALGSVWLSLPVWVFALGLVASGVYPMDPMRAYPPGTPDTTPDRTSAVHDRHDTAGAVVFVALPVAALVATFVLPGTAGRWSSGVVCIALAIGFVVFGEAWEKDSPSAGLWQKALIVVGWTWLAAVMLWLA